MASVVKVSPNVYLDHRRPGWAYHEARLLACCIAVALWSIVSAAIIAVVGLTFKPEISLGEVIQIALVLFILFAFTLPPVLRGWYLERHPFKVRQVNGRPRRRITVATGNSIVMLRLTARKRRTIQTFHILADGSSVLGVDMSNDLVGVTHAGISPPEERRSRMRVLFHPDKYGRVSPQQIQPGVWACGFEGPGECPANHDVDIRIRVKAAGPWRGHLVIVASGGHETARISRIRLAVDERLERHRLGDEEL